MMMKPKCILTNSNFRSSVVVVINPAGPVPEVRVKAAMGWGVHRLVGTQVPLSNRPCHVTAICPHLKKYETKRIY